MEKTVRLILLITGLAVLLSSLGCAICPLVPQPPTATPTSPPATPTPRPTPTPPPTPTPGVSGEMELYTSQIAGIRIPYPQDWVYHEEVEGVIFSDSQEGLEAMDAAESPLLIVFAGPPERISDSFDGAASAQELLENGLEGLCQEESCEVGASEPRKFGETPGLMVELSWEDPYTQARIRGYLITAFSDAVAGIGVGFASAEDWPTYGPYLETMLTGLELFPPQLPEPVERGTISPGSTVEGTLPVGGTEVWAFEAKAGEYVSIVLEAVDPTLDPYLELYDKEGHTGAGSPIASDDDSGGESNSMIADFPIEATGTYYIHATPYSGHGDYRLTLTVSDAPAGGGELQYGEEVEGELSGGGRHAWTFMGREGDEVSIAVKVLFESKVDPYVELYSPDGELLISDDDSGGGFDALIEYYLLPVSGEYRIMVSDVAREPGTYRLTLNRAQLQIKGRLTYGQPAQAKLGAGERHNWQFEGKQGEAVTISMVPTGEWWDTYLELFAPSGRLLAGDFGSGVEASAAIMEFELPTTGVYRVLARGYGENDAGAYRITVERVELKIQGRLSYGQTITATLEANTRHHWQFEGKEGDTVTISMKLLKGELDPHLELFAPGGELVATDDDSGGESNAEIYYTLPLTGVYRVVARSYKPDATGTYQLTLK